MFPRFPGIFVFISNDKPEVYGQNGECLSLVRQRPQAVAWMPGPMSWYKDDKDVIGNSLGEEFLGTHMLHVWYMYLYLPTSKNKNQPNVGEYTIHGSYGYWRQPQKNSPEPRKLLFLNGF